MRRKLKNRKLWRLGTASILLALAIISSAYVNAQDTADFGEWMQDLLEIQVGKDPKKIRVFIKNQGSCSGEVPYLLMKSGADDLRYPTNDFCNKPFQAICGNLKYNFEAKQKRYDQFNKKVEANAAEYITRIVGPRPKKKRNERDGIPNTQTFLRIIEELTYIARPRITSQKMLKPFKPIFSI